jgi:hypothetical protein
MHFASPNRVAAPPPHAAGIRLELLVQSRLSFDLYFVIIFFLLLFLPTHILFVKHFTLTDPAIEHVLCIV